MGQTATYDAPAVDLSKLINPQTGLQYNGLSYTMELTPADRAVVNADWQCLNGCQATLACQHATTQYALLTFTATDKGAGGADPIFQEWTRTRKVIIAKKAGDASGVPDGEWVIPVKVQEVKELPNPAVDGQDKCAVKYKSQTATTTVRTANCVTTGQATMPGDSYVKVTIPGDDDTEDVVATLTLRATRNARNVQWDPRPADMKVDESQPIQAATWQLLNQPRANVTNSYYSISAPVVFADGAKPNVSGASFQVTAKAVGTAKLMLSIPQDNTYEKYERTVSINVGKKNSDLSWPAGQPEVEVGAPCQTIAAAASAEGATITYTVAEARHTSPKAADGSYDITTDYATIAVAANGTLTVCGKHQGTVHITACASETAAMLPDCKSAEVTVTQPNPKSLPDAFIKWVTTDIHGVVGQNATYEAPVVDLSKLTNAQTGQPYHGIELSMALSPADKANVRDDWRDNANGTLECQHATNGTPAILTLTAHDNGDAGCDPIYKDRTWQRKVIIAKKAGDKSGFTGSEWTDGIDLKVLDERELPNPAANGQAPCGVTYTVPVDWLKLTTDADRCVTSVQPTKPGTETITVTIPGDDDTEPVSGTIEVRATRNSRNVQWIDALATMKVDAQQSVPSATWQLRGQPVSNVPSKHYSIVTTASLRFVDGQHPNPTGGSFDIQALAVGTPAVKLSIDQDDVYEAYEKTVPVSVIKKDADIDWDQEEETISAGGECVDLMKAVSEDGATITYSVVGATEGVDAQGNKTFTTTYATVVEYADKLHVCGTSAGTVVIKACAEETDQMEAGCQEVVVNVTEGDVKPIPADYITWPTDAIEGVVAQTAKYEAPTVHREKIKDAQTGADYATITFTMTLTPADRATVNADWQCLDGCQATLACQHATATPATLTLTAHDTRTVNGQPAPLYLDRTWTRPVVIAKKKGDSSGVPDGGWTLPVKVEVPAELPTPKQDDCDIEYTSAATWLALRKTDNDDKCYTSVTATQPGTETVTVTIPGDDDTEPVTGTITVVATRNDRQVQWIYALDNMVVDARQAVMSATWKEVNNPGRSTVPADCYSIVQSNGPLVAFADGQQPNVTGPTFDIVANAVGDAQLRLLLPETPVYEKWERTLTVHIDKKKSDLTWPVDEQQTTEVGGECLTIDAAASAEGATITYTVAEARHTSPKAADGSYDITTDYATIAVAANGTLTVCGKNQGTVHITACASETDAMLPECKTITVVVESGDLKDIPDDYIAWGDQLIEGVVAQTATYDAPKVNHSALVSAQTHQEYRGIHLTMTLTPADRATVNDDWRTPDPKGNATLACLHATTNNATLTLLAHDRGDNGAAPIYRDRSWTRPVSIDKKQGDDAGFGDEVWTNGLDVKVEEVKELPNPAVGDEQDKCQVRYEPQADFMEVRAPGADCVSHIVAHKEGTVTVTVTIPGDEDTYPVVGDIEVRATRNSRYVEWMEALEPMKVNGTQPVVSATWQEYGKSGRTTVEAGAYSLGGTPNSLSFADGEHPNVTGPTFLVKALAIGTAEVTLQLDETEVYEGYSRTLTVPIDRQASDFNWPTDDQRQTEVGGECLTIDAATASTAVTYTVEEETNRETVDDVTIITTAYATVQVNADNSLTICGKHKGTLHITACAEQSADMEQHCESIIVSVVPGAPRTLPEGYITWGTDDIEGTVDQTATYDAPKRDASKLLNDQTGEEYQGIVLTLTLDPADKAIVNDDWKKLDGTDATLDCKHATKVPAVLTLRAHDNGDAGADPIYQDTYWRRNVVISKRQPGVDWENLPDWPADGTITALVDDIKPLPNPDGVPEVKYVCADPSVIFPGEAQVKPTQDGDFVILITLPETDDVLSDSREIKLVVDKRTYDVDWDTTPLSTQVGSSVEVPVATVTPWDGEAAKVEAQYYSLPGGSSLLAHFADGDQPSVDNASFTVKADAPGDALVNVTLPETRVYQEYNENLPVRIDKRGVTVTFNGDEWYRGEIGDKLTLPVARASEALQIVFEMLPGYDEYVLLRTLPDASAEADLRKVTPEALGVIHTLESALTKQSNDVQLHFEVLKRSNDLMWSVADREEGVVDNEIVLPLAVTIYGDPTKITYTAESADGKGHVTLDVQSDGVHVHCDNTGKVTVTASIPEGDSNLAASTATTVDVKAGAGDLIWPVNAEYNSIVEDPFSIVAPHSTYVADEDIDIYIPELPRDQYAVVDGQLTFTPSVGGDFHIIVTVPDTDDRTGASAQTTVHVSKITPIIEWEVTSWPEEKLKWQDNVVIDMPDATSPNFQGEFHYMSADENIARFERTPEGQLQLVMQGGHGPVNLYVYTEATNRYEDGQTDEVEAYIEGHAALQAINETTLARPVDNNTYDLLGRRVIGKPQPGVYVKAGKLIQIK